MLFFGLASILKDKLFFANHGKLVFVPLAILGGAFKLVCVIFKPEWLAP
jgi:hypothetical protein